MLPVISLFSRVTSEFARSASVQQEKPYHPAHIHPVPETPCRCSCPASDRRTSAYHWRPCSLCGSASRCVVQTETGTLKRGVRVRVHLTDLYTGFPQRIGARCGDIQCRSCNGDRVLGAIHHIPLRRTDLLIGIAAERQIRKDRLAICAGDRISDFVASAVIEPVGHTCQGFSRCRRRSY